MDCFGNLIKITLAILNIILLLIGLAVFIIAIILHWARDVILGTFDNSELEIFIDLTAIGTVSIVFLIIGIFIILLSIAGLIGICCSNRFFLVIYEIIIILIFLTHGIVLIVGAVKIDDIEDFYRKTLNSTMKDLNNATFVTNEPDKATTYCAAFKLLSESFGCCGVNGPDDFKIDPFTATQCCESPLATATVGCADKSWNILKDEAVSYLVIPNGVILGFELLIIVVVIILIRKIKSNKSRRDDYIPSTYYKK